MTRSQVWWAACQRFAHDGFAVPAVLPIPHQQPLHMQTSQPLVSGVHAVQAAAQQSSGQRRGGSAGGRGSRAGPSVREMRLVHKRETNRAAQQRWRDRRKVCFVAIACETPSI